MIKIDPEDEGFTVTSNGRVVRSVASILNSKERQRTIKVLEEMKDKHKLAGNNPDVVITNGVTESIYKQIADNILERVKDVEEDDYATQYWVSIFYALKHSIEDYVDANYDNLKADDLEDIIFKVDEFAESQEAFLLHAGVAFMCNGKFLLNLNDTFAWGITDCEEVPKEEIQDVVVLFRKYGFSGICYYASKKRNGLLSEFHDINRGIEFVKNEEDIKNSCKTDSEKAYKKVTYTIGASDGWQKADN